ncbi:MAG: hypothetical protein R6U84_10515 [Candidatus Cloacimonadales bacterium]
MVQITNSSLLTNPEVRQEIQQIDLILPSLDAASQAVFRKINRASAELKIEQIIEGLLAFREEFSGKMWLEVFLLPGVNDTREELSKLKAALRRIAPDEVQLNTLDRPGTEPGLEALSPSRMQEIADFLQPLPVTIIAKFQGRQTIASFDRDIESTILETIKRRPCTASDLAEILGTHINEINKYLSTLLKADKISSEEQERGTFFRAR